MQFVHLIHTVRPLLTSFEAALGTELPGVRVTNTLDEYLASDPDVKGFFSTDNRNRLFHILKVAELTKPDLIVTTCSTLTPEVELLRPLFTTPIIAIDDAMCEAAVAGGTAILVLATAHSTLAPTCRKLLVTADRMGRTVTLETVVCPEAYAAMKTGDLERHDELLRGMSLPKSDVIVLAQASMARMEKEIAQITGRPTYSSPSWCVKKIVSFFSEKISGPKI